MKNVNALSRTLLVLLCFGLVGCQTDFDMAEMAAKQRARPAELDQLEPFIGNWSSTTECKMMMGSSDAMQGTGTGKNEWAVNKRYLVGHMTADMGGEMGSMNGVEVWTWDPSIRKFRTWWFDDWGTNGRGTAKYDEKSDTWRMRGKIHNTVEGRNTTFRGSVKMVDNDTMEWTWAEYYGLGLFKFLEMTGTSKRQ